MTFDLERSAWIASFLYAVSAAGAAAQDPHAGMDMPGMAMPMVGPLGVPMDRSGSGTTWIPDAAPLPARHVQLGTWDLMAHGTVFVQYDRQTGPRGDDQLGSLNWGMLMLGRPLAGGRVQLRTMLSLDPATVGGSGYPLLVQTGETYRGRPIQDRQHPHDFWMELAAVYERAVSESLGVQLYLAPSGEPALGPVAFMHRPSAFENPFAPLSHHWQDATHIAFGVATVGLFGPKWKLEGSAFNGREPDEERWGFDPIRLDSWSGRLTVNPGAAWSLTVGAGHLESPESLHPEESMKRVVASVLYGEATGAGSGSSALVWGANRHGGSWTHSAVAETSHAAGAHTVFVRVEGVQKSAEEVGVPASVGIDPETVYGIGTATLGGVREVGRLWGLTGGVGASGTVTLLPAALEEFYGSRAPLGFAVFVRVRPFARAPMEMDGM